MAKGEDTRHHPARGVSLDALALAESAAMDRVTAARKALTLPGTSPELHAEHQAAREELLSVKTAMYEAQGQEPPAFISLKGWE